MAETNVATTHKGQAEGDAAKRGGGFGPYKAGPQYAKGDPAKGRDPERDVPMHIKAPTVAMRDRRAYLVDQAVKNESANDEVNAKQVELNQQASEAMFEALDPDKLRDETTEEALEELDRHTPEGAQKAREQRLKILAANQARLTGQPIAKSHTVAAAPVETKK